MFGRYLLRAAFLQNWIVNFRLAYKAVSEKKLSAFSLNAYRPLGKAIVRGKY